MKTWKPLSGRTAHVLTSSEIENIHAATLRVLEEVGVEFQDPEALALFRKNAGASVDGSRVRFTPRLIEWALEQAPAKFYLRARNPKFDLLLGDGNTYYTSAFGATFVCDSAEQQYRQATLSDLQRYLILCDQLENVHYCLTAFIPQDIPPRIAEVYATAVQFNYTEKHHDIGVPTSEFVDHVIGIGRIVAASSGVEFPTFSFGITINSPLVYSSEVLPKTVKAAKNGIPVRIVSGAMAGGTAPVTLAGTLVVQNAEVLAGITLCQLVNPGCPVMYGTFAGGMDMRVGKWVAGGPELSLINAATAQLCARYNIPLGYGTGGISDSRIPDVRAGMEKGLTTLFAALCGVEVIHDGVSGLIASGMAINFEQLVIDNEIAGIVNRLLRGIEVNEGALAFDVINSVGPGGHFLDQKHTVTRFKTEHHISALLSRDYLLEWPASPEENLLEQARCRVQQILESHRPVELDSQAKARIQKILTDIGGERHLF